MTNKFYVYDQNNSEGFFLGYHYIAIEAKSYLEANEIAENETDIYFDDDFTIDCPCCGTRWSKQFNDNIDNYDIFEDLDKLKDYLKNKNHKIYYKKEVEKCIN